MYGNRITSNHKASGAHSAVNSQAIPGGAAGMRMPHGPASRLGPHATLVRVTNHPDICSLVHIERSATGVSSVPLYKGGVPFAIYQIDSRCNMLESLYGHDC